MDACCCYELLACGVELEGVHIFNAYCKFSIHVQVSMSLSFVTKTRNKTPVFRSEDREKPPSPKHDTTHDLAQNTTSQSKQKTTATAHLSITEENLTQPLIIIPTDPEITSTMGGGTPVVVQGTAVAQPYNPYEHKA